MDTKKLASKRRTGRSNEMPQSPGTGAKRRRIHETAKMTQEPEPMDIDPPVESTIKKTAQVSLNSNSMMKQPASRPPVAALPASVAAVVSQDSSPANRFVPQAPPTVAQVLDRLRRPKSNIKKKMKKTKEKGVPKPPPPTPSIMSPRPSIIVTEAFKPTPTSEPIHPRRRRFMYRAVAFFWFAVMMRVTFGFVETPSYTVVSQQVRSTSRQTKNAIQSMVPSFLLAKPQAARIYSHVKPPAHVDGTEPRHQVLANITLREFLADEEGFHLALAPAFFGIYAYTGAFMAWDNTEYLKNIKSVAGASAGAMAAVILAAGIEPHKVADLGKSMTLQKFADPPGLGGAFKGNKFEAIMEEFILNESPNCTMLMEDSTIPVAVTAFDLKSLQGRILTRGSMARAARASATFPLLFQPVSHDGGILIDGGVTDMLGLRGLAAFSPTRPKRVVNVAVGGFMTSPPGPQSMPDGVKAKEVLSVSILNTPQCGPWAMANGPRAIEAARRAMMASLNLPLYHGKEKGHYELHVDALSFVE